jgi:Recombination endonuclease VII
MGVREKAVPREGTGKAAVDRRRRPPRRPEQMDDATWAEILAESAERSKPPTRTRAYSRWWFRRRLWRSNLERAGREPVRCEACGGDFNRQDHQIRMTGKGVFDHDHGTGQFRGWLCGSCNASLGLAGDNPAILRALADYLERTSCSPTRPKIS